VRWFLVETKHVPGRIAEARDDLARPGFDALDHRSALCFDRIAGRDGIVDHAAAGSRPVTNAPLTCPVVSSNACVPSPRVRMDHPKTAE
jgi:hypothetical protein